MRGGLCPSAPASPWAGPRPPTGGGPRSTHLFAAAGRACRGATAPGSPLALLVARVGADDHDPAMPADHPALVADPLDARLDLHWLTFSDRVDVTCSGRRCGHG